MNTLDQLIEALRSLPGVGQKSAQRMAYHLLQHDRDGAWRLSAALADAVQGLKTSLRYLLEKLSPEEIAARMPDLCASYQQAVVDALVRKASAALDQSAYASIGLSGGVSNNRTLRLAMENLATRKRLPVYIAQPKHTGDNAGMIAFAAWADPSAIAINEPGSLRIEPSLALA